VVVKGTSTPVRLKETTRILETFPKSVSRGVVSSPSAVVVARLETRIFHRHGGWKHKSWEPDVA